jgi:hypothetical protein
MSALPVVQLDFEKAATASKEELRVMIAELEETLKQFPEIEMPEKNHFSFGVYGRELPISKGSLLVGKIHKRQTMNVILKGKVSVMSQDGLMHLSAGDLFVSTPGAKRVIFAHEDSSWLCCHGTHETDLEKIEQEFIAKDYSEISQGKEESLCLG